jgi:putative endonuclease
MSESEIVRMVSHPQHHHVYIVRCADGSLYAGYAMDPDSRLLVHNAGRGARYTAGRRPVTLVHSEAFETKSEALKREREIKRLRRAKKEALIAGTLALPKRLAVERSFVKKAGIAK